MANFWQRLIGGTKALPKDMPLKLTWNGYSFIVSPTNISNFITNAYLKNPAIYSIIKTLSDKFAAVPWIEYKVSDRKELHRYKAATSAWASNRVEANRLKRKAMDEVQTTTDFGLLMRQPNRAQTFQDFMQAALTTKLITGAAPIFANKGENNNLRIPSALYILPTQFLELKPESDLYDIESIILNINGVRMPIERQQVFYWRYFDPDVHPDGRHLYGLSPLKSLMRTIEANNYNIDAQAFMFKYHGATGIFTPKDEASSGMLQHEPALSNARQALTDLLSRDNDSSRPLFPTPLDYHTFGMDARQMELVETSRISKEDMANVFNYPPTLINAERSTDNNMSHAISYVLTNTLYSEFVGFRDFVNNWLLPKQFGDTATFFDFDLSAMPELQDEMDALSQTLERMWWLSPNERRAAMKWDELEDDNMNRIFIPGTLKPIEDADMGSVQLNPDEL